jgi:hypothetical protein
MHKNIRIFKSFCRPIYYRLLSTPETLSARVQKAKEAGDEGRLTTMGCPLSPLVAVGG